MRMVFIFPALTLVNPAGASPATNSPLFANSSLFLANSPRLDLSLSAAYVGGVAGRERVELAASGAVARTRCRAEQLGSVVNAFNAS